MRKIKPFNMLFKDYNVRITRIRQFKEMLYRIERNLYKFTILLKKEGVRTQVQVNELEATDLEGLKIQIRLILNQNNFRG